MVPEKFKNDYGSFLDIEENGRYSYLEDTPFLMGNKLFGLMVINTDDHFGMIDLHSKNIYSMRCWNPKVSFKKINYPIATIGDSVLVSTISFNSFVTNPDSVNLPGNVQDHLRNGGFSIQLSSIRTN